VNAAEIYSLAQPVDVHGAGVEFEALQAEIVAGSEAVAASADDGIRGIEIVVAVVVAVADTGPVAAALADAPAAQEIGTVTDTELAPGSASVADAAAVGVHD